MMRFIIGQWPRITDAGSRRRLTIPQSCTIPRRNASLDSDRTPPFNVAALVRASHQALGPHSPGLHLACTSHVPGLYLALGGFLHSTFCILHSSRGGFGVALESHWGRIGVALGWL